MRQHDYCLAIVVLRRIPESADAIVFRIWSPAPANRTGASCLFLSRISTASVSEKLLGSAMVRSFMHRRNREGFWIQVRTGPPSASLYSTRFHNQMANNTVCGSETKMILPVRHPTLVAASNRAQQSSHATRTMCFYAAISGTIRVGPLQIMSIHVGRSSHFSGTHTLKAARTLNLL